MRPVGIYIVRFANKVVCLAQVAGASRRVRVQGLPTFFSQRDARGWCDGAAKGRMVTVAPPAALLCDAHRWRSLFHFSRQPALPPLCARVSRDSAAASATALRREYKTVSSPTQAHCYNIVQSPPAISPQSTALRYMCGVAESSHKSNKQI